MEKIFELAYLLHDKLVNTNEYINLKENENIMNNDDSLTKLFTDFKSVQEEYSNLKNDALFKKMHDIKYQIDINENVINYNNAYNKYMVLVDEITNIVFEDLIEKEDIIKEIRKILVK